VSQPGGNGAGGEGGGASADDAFVRLEDAVGELIDRLSATRLRAEQAEAKNAELADLVQRFTGDEKEAEELMSRLGKLEVENEQLRGRLDEGRAGVERMIARIRFLESQ
jgi:predicted nuclease with TOPRIM domain